MLKKMLYVVVLGAGLHCEAFGQSVDDKLRGFTLKVQFIRSDNCDANCTIVINSTADGNVIVRPG